MSDDIPEWAMEEARTAYLAMDDEPGMDDGVEIIARALVKAKEQGIAEGRKRAAEIDEFIDSHKIRGLNP